MPKPEQGDWWDRSYSVVSGCNWYSGIAPLECANCFMMQYLQFRPVIRGKHSDERPDVVTTHPERLVWLSATGPALRWLCSIQGDLFHPEVPDEFVMGVLNHIHDVDGARFRRDLPPHEVYILTKRYERARKLMVRFGRDLHGMRQPGPRGLMLMASAGTQAMVERALRAFASQPWAWGWHLEPLLEPVSGIARKVCDHNVSLVSCSECCKHEAEAIYERSIGRAPRWVVVGGETGQRARLTDPKWITGIIKQCAVQKIPVWVKAVGVRWAKDHNVTGKAGLVEDWPNTSWTRNRPDFEAGGSRHRGWDAWRQMVGV